MSMNSSHTNLCTVMVELSPHIYDHFKPKILKIQVSDYHITHLICKKCIIPLSAEITLQENLTGCHHFVIQQRRSSFTRTDGCQAKSGSNVPVPADLALDKATKSAPGFLDSKALVPGFIIMY